ncbi:unnamed protein product [Owenia fusiformis]|uniref:VWFA domain-containing protein n=1 Tax=Owenia fusiformis TaxID=6347 RepID=A0A8S4PEY3_OWEFU|nr:unnamed protein product [Owenia fusiformis]
MMSLYIATTCIFLGVVSLDHAGRQVEVYGYQKLFGLDKVYKKDLCMDIVFVIDRSCSIPEADLVNEYRVIESAITGIAGFGPDKTRVALVTFDDGARIVFDFNDDQTREGLLNKLDELKQDTTQPDRCKTFTWEALKLTRTHPNLFGGVEKNSDREKIIMILTDGVPFENEKNREEVTNKTIKEGELNDADGIKTMVFTIKNKKGNLPPKELFEKLAYTMRWMFQVEDALVDQFEIRVFPLLARFTCPYSCSEAIDLIYVMDRSISIIVDNIKKEKDFFKLVTESFSIGDIRSKADPKASVAMLSYNRNVYKHFTGLDCSDSTCVLSKIDQIPNTHDNFTVTNLALEEVKVIVNQYTRKGLNGIHPVVVLSTDGNTWKVGANSISSPKVSIAVADELRVRGIDTVVVSVPNHRDDPGLKELRGIASHFMFDLQSEYNFTSFDDLRPITPTLVRLICEKYKPNA